MRELMRSVAKGRMKALGADRINRRLKMTDQHGVPNWRRVLTGDLAAKGEAAIRTRKVLKNRRLRRVEK